MPGRSQEEKIRRRILLISGFFFATQTYFAWELYGKVYARLEVVRWRVIAGDTAVMVFGAIAVALLVASFVVKRIKVRIRDPKNYQDKILPYLFAMLLADAGGMTGHLLGQSYRSFEIAVPFFAASIAVMGFHAWRFSAENGPER